MIRNIILYLLEDIILLLLFISYYPAHFFIRDSIFFQAITNIFRSYLKEVIIINDYLRKKVRLLHAMQDIKYKEIAEYLEIKQDSFWSWLHGYYNFGENKQHRLAEIIDDLTIGE